MTENDLREELLEYYADLCVEWRNGVLKQKTETGAKEELVLHKRQEQAQSLMEHVEAIFEIEGWSLTS